MINYHKVTLNKKKTGELIWKAINNSKYTYEKLAEFLQLTSPRVIYEWTNGNKLPSLENFINLVIVLSVKMEDIVALK